MSDLPPGWEWTTLGEVATISGGIQKQPTRAPTENKYPFLRVANVLAGKLILDEVHEIELFPGELERLRLNPGDLLVVEGNGSRSQIGRAALWSGEIDDCVHQNHLIRVRPHSIEPLFLATLWNSPSLRTQIEDVAATTSGLYTLSGRKVSALRLPLPPAAEQRRIVGRVEELSSRLGVGNEMLRCSRIEGLGRMRRALLRDVIPGTALKNWQWTNVSQAGRTELGMARSPSRHSGPNMKPYLRVANVFEARITLDDVKEMHFEPEEFERYKLRNGDVLLNEGQSPELLGRPAIYDGPPNEYAFTNSLIRFIPREDILNRWALLVFRRHMHEGRFRREVRITTNIAHLSVGRFKSIEFPVPPVAVQRDICDAIEADFDRIERLENSLAQASARSLRLNQSLLAEALSGRLVPQDPDEEPASVLLDRVRAARATAADSRATGRARRG